MQKHDIYLVNNIVHELYILFNFSCCYVEVCQEEVLLFRKAEDNTTLTTFV